MDAETASVIGAILHVSRKSGALHTHDAAATAFAIRVACDEWEATERDVVTPDLKESPGWLGYEMKIFHLGRAIDFTMRKVDVWRGKSEVLDEGARVLAELRYGRGRQSFAALLGEHGGGAYGAELVRALGDDAMAGYAIKALVRGRYGAFVDEVRAASEGAEDARLWVRNAAREYVAKFAREVRATRAPRAPRTA
jgi:hypothetical protein